MLHGVTWSCQERRRHSRSPAIIILKASTPEAGRETMVGQHTIVVILSDFDVELPSCEEEGSYLMFVVK